MPPETSLSKRIKRHIVGRARTYFAATAPGFESLCLKELKTLGIPVGNAFAIPGGVEFNGRLVDCYLANLHLRTANRILLRIAQFKASNFSQLEKKTAEIPWELYLPSDDLPQINVSTDHCRLYHTAAIGERTAKSILSRQSNTTPAGNIRKPSNQRIFIRGKDDRFTISIDSSGKHLHKRGLKKHTGKAPLRETTAAAGLLLAGYHGQKPLIDPLCGTGTFSIEAAMIAAEVPAGGFRQFAFMEWPSFRRAQWEYEKARLEEKTGGKQMPLIFASDKDPTACRRLTKCLDPSRLSGLIKVNHQNFFEFLPQDLTDRAGLVAINPPYGRRLESRPKSDQLFKKICIQLKRKYQGWQVILICPSRRLANKVPFKLAAQPISHGGLNPVMMIGTIP